jgi:DNA-binding NtrC family response regulator
MSIVLVVDDEEQMRTLLVRWIGNDGFETQEADTARAALASMDVNPADIVVCDVRMPGESGLWLAAELRKRFPETAILLATGDRTIAPHITMQSGIVAYLTKPFTREDMLDAVQLAAQWHRTAVSERGRTIPQGDIPTAWFGSAR